MNDHFAEDEESEKIPGSCGCGIHVEVGTEILHEGGVGGLDRQEVMRKHSQLLYGLVWWCGIGRRRTRS